MRFVIFRFITTSIIILIQIYSYRMIAEYIRAMWSSRLPIAILRTVFVLFNLPLPILIFIRPHLSDFPDWFITYGVNVFYIWHGTLFFLFLIVAVFHIIRSPFSLTLWLMEKFEVTREALATVKRRLRPERWDSSRRKFLQQGFTVVAGATFAGTAYGVYSQEDYEVNHVGIELDRLPPEFKGFTLTLIADIHSGVFMTKKNMIRYVQAINDLGSDLIVIPGDFVNSMVEEVYPLAEAFSDLRARHGIYGALGNHDFFDDVDKVSYEIEQSGIILLRNAHTEIAKDGARIQLLGVDDTGRSAKAAELFEGVTKGTRNDVPRILLCHRPYFLQHATERQIDLTLSGHTHGGQIVFTKIGRNIIAPARLASPYVAGLYRRGASQLYVTRGIGTVGIPLRVNCPPEITVITLSGRS